MISGTVWRFFNSHPNEPLYYFTSCRPRHVTVALMWFNTSAATWRLGMEHRGGDMKALKIMRWRWQTIQKLGAVAQSYFWEGSSRKKHLGPIIHCVSRIVTPMPTPSLIRSWMWIQCRSWRMGRCQSKTGLLMENPMKNGSKMVVPGTHFRKNPPFSATGKLWPSNSLEDENLVEPRRLEETASV